MKTRAYAVILAGGRGERFWPMSTARKPKQLLALVSRRPLLAEAVARIRPLFPPERILIITGLDLLAEVRRMVPFLPAANLIGEPCSRDTAPAITLAAALIKARDPQAVFCVLTADHVIGDLPVFRRALRDCLRRASETENLFTIGIKPVFPSTGFGYIEAAAGGSASGSATVFGAVRRFVEKPELRSAVRYLAAGCYFWNSGMFIWALPVFEKALRGLAPDLARLLDQLAPVVLRRGFGDVLKKLYPGLRKISVDYALLEKAKNIVMARGDFSWDDVGSWTALRNHYPADARGNVVVGRAEMLDAADNIVVGGEGLVAMLGVKDLVVVRSGASVMVCHKDRVQDIKRLVARLKDKKCYRELV